MGKYVIYKKDMYGDRVFRDSSNDFNYFYSNEFVIYNTLEEAKDALGRSGSNKELKIMDLEEMKRESIDSILHKVPALQSIVKYLKSDNLCILYDEYISDYAILDRKNSEIFYFSLRNKGLEVEADDNIDAEDGEIYYQKNSALYNIVVELFKTLDAQGWGSLTDEIPDLSIWLDWEEQ